MNGTLLGLIGGPDALPSLFSLLAQTTSETFIYGRLEEEWMLPAGLAVLAVVIAFVVYMYRRDAAELHWSIALLLISLRAAAFSLLFWIWLQPQMRVVQERPQNSRVVVLVDVSQSMNWRDSAIQSANTPTRAERIVTALGQSDLIQQLRHSHDVVAMRFFEQKLESIGQFARLPEAVPGAPALPESEDGSPRAIDWTKELAPRGRETRIGEALAQTIADYRGGILAGVVLFTDGQNNGGAGPGSVVAIAKDAGVPILPIGVGSPDRPINVRVSELAVQPRVHPTDEYEVKAYVAASGPLSSLPRQVKLELISKPAGKEGGTEKIEQSIDVDVLPNGEPQVVPFRLTAGDVGRLTLEARLASVVGDTYPRDDRRSADVEIVERKTRILLFAGGPGREYQFLRNQLFRDSSVLVDVVLQIAQPGISQDSNKILDEFPTTASELADYDAIVAFDPDWTVLSEEQKDLLERWVAEQSGGLVVVAGPVYTEKWTGRDDCRKIAALYPVEFHRRVSLLGGRFENRDPRPVSLSREGLDAPFLRVAEDAAVSQRVWEDFEGVFGYYPVRGKKDAASVYARYADPDAESRDEQPIYFCGQLYGSGRVFYMGSGEMWRLRAEDPGYFSRFYTNLIRFVTQERLRRGSKRGVLLIDRDNFVLGDAVVVTAQLTDNDQRPLKESQVSLDVVPGTGEPFVIPLMANPQRPGEFRGQFLPQRDDRYRVQVRLGGEEDEGGLARTIQVEMPDREMQHVERNDAALAPLAKETGGIYLTNLSELGKVIEALPSKARVELQIQKPIPLWDRPWVLAVLVGVLSLEWLVRRLARLA